MRKRPLSLLIRPFPHSRFNKKDGCFFSITDPFRTHVMTIGLRMGIRRRVPRIRKIWGLSRWKESSLSSGENSKESKFKQVDRVELSCIFCLSCLFLIFMAFSRVLHVFPISFLCPVSHVSLVRHLHNVRLARLWPGEILWRESIHEQAGSADYYVVTKVGIHTKLLGQLDFRLEKLFQR